MRTASAIADWAKFPIYIIGPIVGLALAAFVYDYISGIKNKVRRVSDLRVVLPRGRSSAAGRRRSVGGGGGVIQGRERPRPALPRATTSSRNAENG